MISASLPLRPACRPANVIGCHPGSAAKYCVAVATSIPCHTVAKSRSAPWSQEPTELRSESQAPIENAVVRQIAKISKAVRTGGHAGIWSRPHVLLAHQEAVECRVGLAATVATVGLVFPPAVQGMRNSQRRSQGYPRRRFGRQWSRAVVGIRGGRHEVRVHECPSDPPLRDAPRNRGNRARRACRVPHRRRVPVPETIGPCSNPENHHVRNLYGSKRPRIDASSRVDCRVRHSDIRQGKPSRPRFFLCELFEVE